MTNIFDKVNEFASVLKDHDDVVAYRNAARKIETNPEKQKMLEDFRKIQIAAYSESVETGKVTDETNEKMQNFASIIQMNPDINEYLQAEMRFSILFEDIMKIITDAVGVNMLGPDR